MDTLASCFRVPPGFCIPSPRLKKCFGSGDGATSEATRTLARDVAVAYARLCEQCGATDLPVAVRSSGIDEDGALASFAGQHDTYLNVIGVDAIVAATERCWLSARSVRAVEYRRVRRMQTEQARLAVLIQAFVPADVSLVAFSINPVSRQRDEVVINSSWGLGESVVGGTVVPDLFVVDKNTERVVRREIHAKLRMTVVQPHGTMEVPVPSRLHSRRSLSDDQVLETAKLAMVLESRMGWPVDIECAYNANQLYLLQCRPVTAIAVDAVGGHSSYAQPDAQP